MCSPPPPKMMIKIANPLFWNDILMFTYYLSFSTHSTLALSIISDKVRKVNLVRLAQTSMFPSFEMKKLIICIESAEIKKPFRKSLLSEKLRKKVNCVIYSWQLCNRMNVVITLSLQLKETWKFPRNSRATNTKRFTLLSSLSGHPTKHESKLLSDFLCLLEFEEEQNNLWLLFLVARWAQ